MKTNEYIINKSRFVAYMYDLNDIQKVQEILSNLKKEHKKCTHICYAYVYDKGMVLEKCCDDNEPSGTAGRPILNVIKKKNLKNTAIFVVRYFGGIKLGAGGLVRAYTKAVSGLFD